MIALVELLPTGFCSKKRKKLDVPGDHLLLACDYHSQCSRWGTTRAWTEIAVGRNANLLEIVLALSCVVPTRALIARRVAANEVMTPKMAMTTRSSTNVNPALPHQDAHSAAVHREHGH